MAHTSCRVLVLSNECFSQTSSNGRTLMNFFLGWPKENIAQVYIQNGKPDFSVCDRYFCVSDGQALRAFMGKKLKNCAIRKDEADQKHQVVAAKSVKEKHGRNALTMLLRELIWMSGRWKASGFDAWVHDFSPDVVLLQAGDCGFMFALAEKISRKLNIPLVIYNSEGYYFKKFDYFQASGLAHFVYPLFRANLQNKVRRAIKRAYKSIYICEELEAEYTREFGAPAETIYTGTEVHANHAEDRKDEFRASYLGNMGVGRHESLVEIANALQKISKELYLDVYGKIPNDAVKSSFENCPGIRYKGFVSYQEVQKIIAESDLLVHAESFVPFYREDLKYAFSTKIADSLASGRCFLLYAPEDMACVQYLKKNDAAYTVSEKESLEAILRVIVEMPEARVKYQEKALELVAKNHNSERNGKRFQQIICDSLGGQR